MSRAGLAVALTPRQGGGVLMRVCVQPCCAFSVAPTQPFGRVNDRGRVLNHSGKISQPWYPREGLALVAFCAAASMAAVKARLSVKVPVWLISINRGNLSLSFSGTTSTRLVYSLFAYIRRIAYAYRITASL